LRNTPRPALKAEGACAKRCAGRAGGAPDADKFGKCSIDACIVGELTQRGRWKSAAAPADKALAWVPGEFIMRVL
jgi:hypothetical protein